MRWACFAVTAVCVGGEHLMCLEVHTAALLLLQASIQFCLC